MAVAQIGPVELVGPRREDKRMHNIVDLSAGRARSRRSIAIPQDGAQILLFTGVRYVREPDSLLPAFVPDGSPFCDAQDAPSGEAATSNSAACFDLATH